MSHDRMKSLRDEAEATTPGFSEPLHEATMSRVHQARRAKLASTHSADRAKRSHTRPILGWAMGLCTIAVVALLVIFNRPTPVPVAAPDEAPAQFLPAMAELRESTAPFEARIGRPIMRAHQQFSRLRGDAKEFGDFVVRQIDLLPESADAQGPPAL